MKLNSKQIGALRWLKAKPGLLLPHTWDHCDQYQQWGTSHASFAALERKGLAEQRDARTCSIGFWHLTKAGEDYLLNLDPCDPAWNKRPFALRFMTYDSITISVKLTCHGRGMNAKQIKRLLDRVVRCAAGRSKSRSAHAYTETSEKRIESYWWFQDSKP